jgi:hypothetical protein
MTFAKEQREIVQQLQEAGHTVFYSEDIKELMHTPAIKFDFDQEVQHCIATDVIRKFFNAIAESDVYLTCNYAKRGIEGYLGTAVLMELGVAYHLKKKIFLLYDFDKTQPYGVEIAIINPTILNGDLSKISF